VDAPRNFPHSSGMKLCLWLVLSILLPALVNAGELRPVVVVPLKTDVSEAQFFFLRRALKDAERQQASAFVIEMETYGGEVKAAMDNMNALLRTTLPTATFIHSRAVSAGALIALATQKIYMAPDAVIGAAAPVMGSGEDLPSTMKDKTASVVSAMARAAAQKNGHHPDVAAAFVDKTREVRIGEKVVHPEGNLLSLSAAEAATPYEGKPLLSAGTATSLQDMLAQAGLTGPVIEIRPTGMEQLAVWITRLAPLLLLGGILGAYIEFKIPGFGFPGFASLVCFSLYFGGHYIAGLAGWETLLLFVTGLGLIVLELILPGTILPGLLGVLLVIGAILYAMVDRLPSEPVWPSPDMLIRPVVNLSLTFVGTAVAIYFLARFLPQTRLYKAFVLSAAVPAGPESAVLGQGPHIVPGLVGVAHTDLRPSGKALFGERLVDVVSSGDFIEANSSVRIIQVQGARVVVAAA